MRWSALLLAALLSLGNAAGEPAITLRVNLKIAQAPATVNGKVIIERHPDNRLLVVLLEGENYSLRTDRQLDGAEAPRVFRYLVAGSTLWPLRRAGRCCPR